jgi:sialate O-acetylesterase
LADVYGKRLVAYGPTLAGHEVRDREVRVSFRHTDGGLVAKGGTLLGFSVAGVDRKWHPAMARIEQNRVIVSAPEVIKPMAVRYGWANNPSCNLYNGAGLPAAPFRTDDWK